MATPPSPVSQVPQQPAPAVSGVAPIATDTRRCYTCGKPGHLRTHCPDQKKLTSPGQPASNPSSVLFVRQKAWVTTANLQQVTVGNRIVTGFRDTGADVTLVRSEVISRRDIIPGKFFTLTGVGGTRSRVPRAYVFIDWGAGSGMREVGVSDEIPTAVLLGADLGTLVSYYASAQNTQDSPMELSGPTKVLFTDVGVTSGEPVDGQREGEGGVEVRGSTAPRGGEEAPLHVPISDACVVDVKNVTAKCNDVLSVLKVNNSVGRVEEIQSLAAELRSDPDSSLPCSDQDNSAPITSQQLSLCVDGWLADPCSSTPQPALLTHKSLASFSRPAVCSPAERSKQKLDKDREQSPWTALQAGGLETGGVKQLLIVSSQPERQGLEVVFETPCEIRKAKAGRKHNGLWPSLVCTQHSSTAHVMARVSTPRLEEIGTLVDGVADPEGGGLDFQLKLSFPLQVPVMPAALAACCVRVIGDPGRTHHGVHEVGGRVYSPLIPATHLVSLDMQAGGAKETEGMLQLGGIQDAWAACSFPVGLVPKRNQTTRLPEILDLVNASPTAVAFSMSRDHEVSEQWAGARWITIFDQSRGRLPPALTQKVQDESAFTTPCGLPAFTAKLVGVENTPVISPEVMDDLQGGVETWEETYRKGFKGMGPVWVEHLVLLSAVLSHLAEPNLTVSSSNCQGGMSVTQNWEQQDGGGTQRSRTDEVEASMAWLAPQAEILAMSFLGTAGYNRVRDCNYSDPAEPMTDRLHGTSMRLLSLMLTCRKNCAILAKVLASASGTQAPEFNCPFLMHTGATTLGSGTAQGQRVETEEEYLTLSLGRKAPSKPLTYDTIERRCLVIGWAARKVPRDSDGYSRLVLACHKLQCWPNSIARENNLLPNGSLVLWQCNLPRPPEGEHLGKVDLWGNKQTKSAAVGRVRREIAVLSHATT